MPVLQAELQARGQLTAQDSTQFVAMFGGEPGLREQRLSSQSEAPAEQVPGAGHHGPITEGSPPEVSTASQLVQFRVQGYNWASALVVMQYPATCALMVCVDDCLIG